MEQKSLIGEFAEYEGDDITQVIRELVNDKNVDLKTEFKNPVAVTQGQMMVAYCKFEDAPKTAELWDVVIKFYTRNMVSFDRGSRKEVVDSIKAVIHSDRESRHRLLGGHDEEGM